MANFVGRWEIQKSENFNEYMIAIGVDDENRAKALKVLGDDSKLSYTISNNGDDWEFKVTTPAGEKTFKFNLGVEFSTNTLDGRAITAIFSMDGNTLIEKQKGDNFETINERIVDGDQMTMTMKAGNGVSCTRCYKRL